MRIRKEEDEVIGRCFIQERGRIKVLGHGLALVPFASVPFKREYPV
jgi:hypothetical protein